MVMLLDKLLMCAQWNFLDKTPALACFHYLDRDMIRSSEPISLNVHFLLELIRLLFWQYEKIYLVYLPLLIFQKRKTKNYVKYFKGQLPV